MTQSSKQGDPRTNRHFSERIALHFSERIALMTQRSKQGDPLREVPVGARHSAIKLPNWLYSGCVEME